MHDRAVTTPITYLAGVLCLGEVASALIIWKENYADSAPAVAVVFAVLFLIAAAFLRSSRVTAGAIPLGVPCLFEVVSYPSWTRHTLLDSIFQTGYALVALGGLAVAVTAHIARRRSSATTG